MTTVEQIIQLLSPKFTVGEIAICINDDSITFCKIVGFEINSQIEIAHELHNWKRQGNESVVLRYKALVYDPLELTTLMNCKTVGEKYLYKLDDTDAAYTKIRQSNDKRHNELVNVIQFATLYREEEKLK